MLKIEWKPYGRMKSSIMIMAADRIAKYGRLADRRKDMIQLTYQRITSSVAAHRGRPSITGTNKGSGKTMNTGRRIMTQSEKTIRTAHDRAIDDMTSSLMTIPVVS